MANMEPDDDDFVDASDGYEDEEAMSPSEVVAPSAALHVLPSGAESLSEIITARAALVRCGGPHAMPWSASLDACKVKMSEQSPPLFAFSRLLTTDQQNAVCALFAACHAIDACQDTSGIRALRRRLDHLFVEARGGARNKREADWEEAFLAALRRFPVIRKPFIDMIDGRLRAPSPLRFATFEDLVSYSYCFAGAVGLAVIPVLLEDVSSEDIVAAAMVLGVALQLLDMINCVGHHHRIHGGLAVPANALKRHNVTEREVLMNAMGNSKSLVGDERWSQLVAEMLAELQPLLDIARKGGLQLNAGGRFAVLAALKMCNRVIATIQGSQAYDNLTQRTKMFSLRTVTDICTAACEAAASSSSKSNSGYPVK
eukprot:gnl/MRDRNA2_/MRDRNA2_33905_c0_seq1.p1 gnl/MRDRNA2_/MRDRNA2_33905_c0~~gnl/MRDRNA2_/MRDRNA2_33905_c0_seq1.p1  ORF type:complete len:383 (-),score=81.17 gnl/MRDRNA2_/MRDRNA2_33905_c0_seq1:325-1437(-)